MIMRITQRLREKIASSLMLKLMIPLIVVACAISIVFSIVTIGFNARYLESVTESMQEQTLTAQTSSVAQTMRAYYNVFFSLAVDKKLQKIIYDSESGSPAELINRRATEVFKEYMLMDSDVVAIHVSTEEDRLIGYIRSNQALSTIWQDSSSIETIISKCEECRQIQFVADQRLINPYNEPIFHMSIKLWDFFQNRSYGTLIMTLRTRSISNALNSEETSGMRASQSGLVSGSGEYIVHSDQEWVGRNVDEEKENRYRVIRLADTGSYNVRIVNVYDNWHLVSTVLIYNLVMLGSVILILVIYLLTTTGILRKFYKSLSRLIKGIGGVKQGNFDTTVKVSSPDEIGQITVAFNNMVSSLREMDDRRQQENSGKLEALNLQHEAEILALEAQINSHFLANTINMISYTAIEQGNNEVARLLKALSSILRYTFEKSSKPMIVREELRNLDQYLLLQKERLGKKFDYIIDADEEVMNDYIRKLIIQPFVENSILHGFANTDSCGLLQIKVKRFREDGLAIIVQDNGHGLRIQQLEQIRETFSMHKPPETMGIGIENVVYRVNRYYDEPKLFINSSAVTGTRIVMILPALKK